MKHKAFNLQAFVAGYLTLSAFAAYSRFGRNYSYVKLVGDILLI